MNELAEKLRAILVKGGSPPLWDSDLIEALTRAADIIANLPEEPEGYRLVAVRRVKKGEFYLNHTGDAKQWRGSESYDRYVILEPVSLQFKPGDIVSKNICNSIRIVTKEGKLMLPHQEEVEGELLTTCWDYATEDDQEAYLKKYPKTAVAILKAYAREVYSEDKP